MANNNIEEKSPLLFVLDGNEDISKADKAYFDSNRFRGIAHGSTAVFTHFPNFIGTCWIVTALFGLIFFMFLLLLLSTIATAGMRFPKCVAEELANDTVHLVHVHRPGEWNPKETKMMEAILERYPSYKIHLISIQGERARPVHKVVDSITISNRSTTKATSVSSNDILATLVRKKRIIDEARYNPFNINMEAKRLIDMLLHGKLDDKYEPRKIRSTSPAKPSETTTVATTTVRPIKTIDDFASSHPNINIENLTYPEAFSYSPLHFYWPHLNEKLRVFAVRVLQLWQSGGVSFDLQAPLDKIKYLTADVDKKVRSFVITEKMDSEKSLVAVIKVDEEAWRMESKVPCHAFFGEVMMNLRKAAGRTMVRDVMRKSIKVFCKHFTDSKKNCEAFNNH